MPFVRIDLKRGKSAEYRKTLEIGRASCRERV